MRVMEVGHADGHHSVRDADPWWGRNVQADGGVLRRVTLFLISLALLAPLVPAYPGLVCPLRALTGVPCPFCGTSTAIQAASRGDISESLRANPIALMAAALTFFLFATRIPRVRAPVLLLIALPVGLWVIQLNRFALI